MKKGDTTAPFRNLKETKYTVSGHGLPIAAPKPRHVTEILDFGGPSGYADGIHARAKTRYAGFVGAAGQAPRSPAQAGRVVKS